MRFFLQIRCLIVLFALYGGMFLFIDVSDFMIYTGLSYEIIIVSLLGVLFSLMIFAVLDALQYDRDQLSYRVILQLIFLTYAISTPVSYLLFPWEPSKIGYLLYKTFNEDRIVKVMCLMGLFQAGMIMGARFKPMEFNILSVRFSPDRLMPISWVLFILAVIPSLLLIYQGQWSLSAEYTDVFEAMRGQSQGSRIMLYLRFLLILPITWIIMISFMKRKYRWVVVLLLSLIIFTVFKPSRGLLLSSLLTSIICYHYFRKPISIKKGLVILCIVLSISYTLMEFRTTNPRFDRADIALRVVEGGVMFQNTYFIHQYIEHTGDLRWGSGYITGMASFIPQWLLPFELEAKLPSWFLDTFFPNDPSGRMFSIVADGYINFSYPGPLMLGVLFSYIMKILYYSFRKSLQRPDSLELGAIIYIFLCSQAYYLFRGDLVSFVLRMYAYSLIPVIIMVALTLRRRVRIFRKHGNLGLIGGAKDD